MIKGKVTAVEWKPTKKRGPMLSATVTVELTRSRRQVDADRAYNALKALLGKDATLIID